MLTLPTFLPLPEAARKYGLDEARLRALVEKGKIRAGVIAGEMVVSEEEVQKRAERERGSGVRKEDLPEYQKHAHLRGTPIWLSEAERKYNVPNPTIWRWMRLGIIKRLGAEKNRVLLDEADIAYCATIYHTHDPKQGRRVFDSQGLPYKRKTGPLSL